LIRETDGVGARALEACGISLEGTRREVYEIVGRGAQAPAGHIPFTPRSKKVLELALREAIELGHDHIGTEHVLLGLIREGEGVAAQILVRLGADVPIVRRAIAEASEGDARMPRPPEPQEAQPMPTAVGAPASCALCGRDLWDVERSVVGSRGSVCEVCVAAAAEALGQSTEREPRMPPRAAGTPPPATADMMEIAAAFDRGFGGESGLIEGGDENARLADAVRARHPGVQATFVVERVRLVGEDEAEVRFVLLVSPMNLRIPLQGRARRIDGCWKVARETAAQVWRMG
jgi:hypothetical protein